MRPLALQSGTTGQIGATSEATSIPSFKRHCQDIIDRFRTEIPNRTPSLVVTVFGDAVEPHGGEIWLGSLIRLLKPLGINERLVRTSVNRLSRDGWIEATRIGRRSFYRLTGTARQNVRRAERRLYHLPAQTWDGEWRLVFTGTAGVTAEQRAALRKRLTWLGFGMIAPNVFGHPLAPLGPVREVLEETGVAEQVVVMRARSFDTGQGLSTREMVRQCFRLDGLEQEYIRFTDHYRPLATALEHGGDAIGAERERCFLLRTLVLHEYRRILLRDPQLPRSLLPDNWVGFEAQRVCAAIYTGTYPVSERYLMSAAENRNGRIPAAAAEYLDRFGGLESLPPG